MSPDLVVVRSVSFQDTVQVRLAEHDYVIEALAPDSSDQSFHVGTLPRRVRCGKNFCYAHCLRLFHELLPKDTITIA